MFIFQNFSLMLLYCYFYKHREIEQWAQGHTVHKQGGLDWSLGSTRETLGSHLVTWYRLWPENGTISHPLLYQTKLFSELYFLHVLFPLSSPLRISTALCLTQIILILQSSLKLTSSWRLFWKLWPPASSLRPSHTLWHILSTLNILPLKSYFI